MTPKSALGVLTLALLLCSCSRFSLPPTGQLELVVDGRQIQVEPGLGRDFFPGTAPPGGTPLGLYIHLRATDSLPLPQGLVGTRAWVVYNSAVWETGLTQDTTWKPVYAAGFYAGGGPKWGPNVYVDVTVHMVQTGGGTWDILVPDCLIKMSI